jgi:hypothetical protein
MALDDYLESEVAIAVAATAAVLSPRVRGVLRKGAVYGLAGALVAADGVGSFVRGIGRGAQRTARPAGVPAAATTATAGAASDSAGVTGTVAHAAAGGAATNAPPSTPEAAADELAAVAQGDGDAATGVARRGRRVRAEQTDGVANE